MNLFLKTGIFTIVVFVLLSPAALSRNNRPGTVPYTWKNVQMVGGGFVDGIICHPTAPGVRYARTDMGGAYRWSRTDQRWQPLLDWVSYEDLNLMGVESIAIDPSDPNRVYLACGTYTSISAPNAILRSSDQGWTWKGVFTSGGNYDYTKAPYVKHTGIHWLFDIEIDPADPDHAMFTTGYGGHETFNLTDMDRDKPTLWHCMATGIEETVALELLSPPKGAHLVSAVGDYGGFVHWDLDKPAPEGNFDNPHFGNTDGVACAELKPEVIVRVGVGSNQRGGGNIGYSLDSGRTWQPAGQPRNNSSHGSIAVSADGTAWIWTPQRSMPYVTYDRGETWTECQVPANNMRVISDRVNANMFYALDLFGGQLYVSIDKGKTFTAQALTLPNGLPQRGRRGDSRGGQDRLYAAPGKQGDLWIAAFDGLYHSLDTGKTFTQLAPVREIHAFGFGKAAPGAEYPALYLIGVVEGIRGIFRSDDTGKTWVRINDDRHQWGLLLHITGDPKKYGRVYVGTHGRGTMYGDPVEVKN